MSTKYYQPSRINIPRSYYPKLLALATDDCMSVPRKIVGILTDALDEMDMADKDDIKNLTRDFWYENVEQPKQDWGD